jgi:hypothetical protein
MTCEPYEIGMAGLLGTERVMVREPYEVEAAGLRKQATVREPYEVEVAGPGRGEDES